MSHQTDENNLSFISLYSIYHTLCNQSVLCSVYLIKEDVKEPEFCYLIKEDVWEPWILFTSSKRMSEVQERLRLFFFSPVFPPSSSFFLFFTSFSALTSASSSLFLFPLPAFSFSPVLWVDGGWLPAFLNKLVKNVGLGLDEDSTLESEKIAQIHN